MEFTKYPRTFHLPWSQGVQSDDKLIESTARLESSEIVVSVKMDGENTSIYRNHVHARSLDSRGGEDRSWVKALQSRIGYQIPENHRICGENVWARHSVPYDDLKSYFYGFSVWDGDLCFSWDETESCLESLGIPTPDVLYRGAWDEKLLRKLASDLDTEKTEGYVVRLASSFLYSDFDQCVAKFVRKNHVQTDKHWRHQQLVPNRLSA